MSLNPLTQFAVKSIYKINFYGYDISITNSSLSMFVAVLLFWSFYRFMYRNPQTIPTRPQAFIETIYFLVLDIVESNIGKTGKKFLPLIFSIFIFVLLCNVLGMLPYGFTVTSQLIITYSLAMLVFMTRLIYGFMKHGLKFFSLFLLFSLYFFIIF